MVILLLLLLSYLGNARVIIEAMLLIETITPIYDIVHTHSITTVIVLNLA